MRADLSLCLALPDDAKRAHVVACRVHGVRLPAVYDHHDALVHQHIGLHNHRLILWSTLSAGRCFDASSAQRA